MATSRRQVTLETEIQFEFSDIDKAREYFLEGEWKNHFYTYHSMSDLCASLAYSFKRTQDEWEKTEELPWKYKRFVEGYGEFVQDEADWYVCKDRYFGEIRIRIIHEDEPS